MSFSGLLPVVTRCITGHHRRCRGVNRQVAAGIMVAMLCAASTVSAAELERVTFGGGVLLKPTDISGFSVGLDFRPEAPPGWLTCLGDDVHYEVAASRWLDLGAGTEPADDIWFVEAGGFWRYRPDWLADLWHIDAGAGLALASDQKIDEDRTLDSSVLFNADLSIARRLGRHSRWTLGARWRHNSNGGILGDPDRNPGADVVLLEVSYRL